MSCQCRAAMMKTYRELRKLGQREDLAYDSAVQLYRHYHPECRRVDAYHIVADWLEECDFDADSTPG